MLRDVFYRQKEFSEMRPPVPNRASEAQAVDHVQRAVYPVRRAAQRVVERHYDEAGRLRSERIGEFVAQEWTISESLQRDDQVSVATADTEPGGCLSGIVSVVICAAFLIGLAVIGGVIGAWVAGNGGVAVGLIAAPTLGLRWLQSGSPPGASDP